jgi:hypothetical protein
MKIDVFLDNQWTNETKMEILEFLETNENKNKIYQ